MPLSTISQSEAVAWGICLAYACILTLAFFRCRRPFDPVRQDDERLYEDAFNSYFQMHAWLDGRGKD
jgi:hypothetical protein